MKKILFLWSEIFINIMSDFFSPCDIVLCGVPITCMVMIDMFMLPNWYDRL